MSALAELKGLVEKWEAASKTRTMYFGDEDIAAKMCIKHANELTAALPAIEQLVEKLVELDQRWDEYVKQMEKCGEAFELTDVRDMLKAAHEQLRVVLRDAGVEL